MWLADVSLSSLMPSAVRLARNWVPTCKSPGSGSMMKSCLPQMLAQRTSRCVSSAMRVA
jgi:hypothetical protein